MYENETSSKATRPRTGSRDRPSRRHRRLLGLVENLEDPLGRGDPALQQVEHRGDLRQRLGELAGVLDERLHVAELIAPDATRSPPITATAT